MFNKEQFAWEIAKEEFTLEKSLSSSPAQLIVYNDDVNTFDWVIESLVEICDHNELQAEQCALIIHYKGKACVKHGTQKKLSPLKDALCDRGISAVIEE